MGDGFEGVRFCGAHKPDRKVKTRVTRLVKLYLSGHMQVTVLVYSLHVHYM